MKCVWQIILKGETPKLILVAQEFRGCCIVFILFLQDRMMEMFSWSFPSWMFCSALFDHRKVLPSFLQKRWRQKGFSFICYGCIAKEIDVF